MATPNMNLNLAIVGTTPGPQWALDVNNAFDQVDAHDHSPGYGVQITPTGLNINSNLAFNSNNAINLRSTRFDAQPSPLALVTDIGALYVSGIDLYYNDLSGNQVRMTQGGNVAGSSGSITGLVSPASASYVSLNQTFVFQSGANLPANIDGGAHIFRNLTVNSFGITLQAPTLSGDFTLTLPTIPVATSFMQLDTAGAISASVPVSQGITAANIANNTITAAQIAPFTITNAEIAAFTIVGYQKLASGSVTDAELNTDSVITSKIANGAVTKAKLSAWNGSVSSNVGFSTTSTSFVDVSNSSNVITTSGRPVAVSFTFASAGVGNISVDTGEALSIRLVRDTTVVGEYGPISPGIHMPVFNALDAPGAGTYTYFLRIKTSVGSLSVALNNIRVVVQEL
jgi:hypothetical protein